MKVFLVRHGTSEHRKNRNHEEAREVRLSRLGRIEAAVAAASLRPYHIEYLASSHIVRALETAEIIRSRLHIPLHVDERFEEFIVSKTITDKARFKEIRAKKRLERGWCDVTDGETFNHSLSRLSEGLADIESRGVKTACVVCHELLIQNIFCSLASESKDLDPHGVAHAQIIAFEFSEGKFVRQLPAGGPEKRAQFINRIVAKIFK